MKKPQDVFNPKGDKPNDPWSNMEEWGGKSWFKPTPTKEPNGNRDSNTASKRSNKHKPKLA